MRRCWRASENYDLSRPPINIKILPANNECQSVGLSIALQPATDSRGGDLTHTHTHTTRRRDTQGGNSFRGGNWMESRAFAYYIFRGRAAVALLFLVYIYCSREARLNFIQYNWMQNVPRFERIMAAQNLIFIAVNRMNIRRRVINK